MRSIYMLAMILAIITFSGCVAGTPVANLTASNTAVTDNASAPTDRVPRITVDELLQKINSGADILIVDSRTDVKDKYSTAHIKGAVPVPLADITEKRWAPPADLNKEIVFYCTCPNDRTSATAAMELIGKGYSNVKALKGGYNAWVDAGYPLEPIN